MHLHIVSFDIPFPPTYGGVIDVFFRIRALHQLGVKIYLHTFEYHRPRSQELNQFCEAVYYYPRKNLMRSLPVRYPHIVKSRASDALLERLLLDDMPILFEGLHTTYFLAHPEFSRRLKLVRTHNVEWEYYRELAERETNYFYKQYYQAESKLLRDFEEILIHADHVLAISPKDTSYYKRRLPQTQYLPAAHGHEVVSSQSGQGEYCLYHGNLSVPENHEAALWLIYEVFSQLGDIPLIVAGSDPKPDLIEATSQFEHVLLRPNPSRAEMIDLLQQAHIHTLPTFQPTGIKLKLLNSLFSGRFVVVNPPMIEDTGLAFSAIIAENEEAFRKAISRHWIQNFTEIDIAQRKATLLPQFDDIANASMLVGLLKGALA